MIRCILMCAFLATVAGCAATPFASLSQTNGVRGATFVATPAIGNIYPFLINNDTNEELEVHTTMRSAICMKHLPEYFRVSPHSNVTKYLMTDATYGECFLIWKESEFAWIVRTPSDQQLALVFTKRTAQKWTVKTGRETPGLQYTFQGDDDPSRPTILNVFK